MAKMFRWILLALPPMLGAWFIHHFGVNMLWWDEIGMLPLVTRNEFPSFHELFAQHNEHRILFPRILYYIIAKLSHMNSIAVMYCSLFLVCILYVLLIQYIFRTGKNTFINTIISFIVGVILFNPIQSENILWAFQIGFYMTYVFSCLSFIFFYYYINSDNYNKKYFYIFMLISLTISSFSSIHGLLGWMTILVVWPLIEKYKILAKPAFIIFVFSSLIIWTVYFIGYVKPSYHPNLNIILESPILFCKYIFAILGRPYKINTFSINILYIQGMCIFILTFFSIFLFKKNKSNNLLVPICFIVYSFLVLCSIAIGRAGFGVEQAYSSRYTTYSLGLFIGIFLFIFLNSYNIMSVRLIIIMFIYTFIINFYNYLGIMKYDYETKILYRNSIREGNYLNLPNGISNYIKNYESQLRQLKYNLFNE